MKKRLLYCDCCARKILGGVTDKDFAEGKTHVYYMPTGAEPEQAEPTDDIEIIIKTQRKRISSTEYLGINSVDLCKVCLDGMLEDLICNPTIEEEQFKENDD